MTANNNGQAIMLKLKLYVSGMPPAAKDQVLRLREILDAEYAQDYDLEVRDIFDHADEAYEDTIYATPTLLRQLPPPVVRIIGDLSDRERVLVGLKLEPPTSAVEGETTN
jgi:circadian clock protein KaiB